MANQLSQDLGRILEEKFPKDIVEKFRQRMVDDKLTKQENPQSHFCVYFAACDFDSKQVFMGHHIKSGLWLFNGGHIDENEGLLESLKREIDEEWGVDAEKLDIKRPALLTITDIYNPTKQPCRLHFDVWYFINVDKSVFAPEPSKLATEFHAIEWLNLNKARQLAKDKNTLLALDFIEENYF